MIVPPIVGIPLKSVSIFTAACPPPMSPADSPVEDISNLRDVDVGKPTTVNVFDNAVHGLSKPDRRTESPVLTMIVP
jgi:hypothetical protein